MLRSGTIPLLVAALLAAPATLADEIPRPAWELAGGRTELVLNRHLLEDLGIELITSTVTVSRNEFEVSFFEIDDEFPTLLLTRPGGALAGNVHGALRHRGSLILAWDGGELEVSDFELVPAAGKGLFDIRTDAGLRLFFLDHAHAQFVPSSGEYLFLNMDLRLTREMARELGRPELEGLPVGALHVRTQRIAVKAGLAAGACEADFTGTIDVELTALDSLAEACHDQTAVAMASSATLENVGIADVPWYGTIPPNSNVGQHPYLYLNLYRMADGVFVQIGASDLKHAFFAINGGEECECPGGQVLYDGCNDTYGVSTNTNRFYLGPRDELTAATGDWTSTGSHFDDEPVDDFRDHGGETDHSDPFEHRLTATVDDLSTPDARYFHSAWYLVKGDVDIFNGMGFREVTPTFSPTFSHGSWTFPTVAENVLVLGPAVNAWVDPAAPGSDAAVTVVDQCTDVAGGDCDGHLQVSAQATAVAEGAGSFGVAGAYRYEYAVMNLDYDRQIEFFSIPLPAGVEVSNPSFRDTDSDAGNDWVVSVGPTAISWHLPNGQTNGLDWGTLYNFGFEADAEPADVFSQLGVFAPGFPETLSAATKGPSSGLPSVTLSVSKAGLGTGGVTSSPAGVDCGTDCEEMYPHGTLLVLSAAADSGSCLASWTEGTILLGTEKNLDLTLTSDRTLVAEFEFSDQTLPTETVTGIETFTACEVLTTGTSFTVESTGDATLRAGSKVVLSNGFSVLDGGLLTVEVDASLLP